MVNSGLVTCAMIFSAHLQITSIFSLPHTNIFHRFFSTRIECRRWENKVYIFHKNFSSLFFHSKLKFSLEFWIRKHVTFHVRLSDQTHGCMWSYKLEQLISSSYNGNKSWNGTVRMTDGLCCNALQLLSLCHIPRSLLLQWHYNSWLGDTSIIWDGFTKTVSSGFQIISLFSRTELWIPNEWSSQQIYLTFCYLQRLELLGLQCHTANYGAVYNLKL